MTAEICELCGKTMEGPHEPCASRLAEAEGGGRRLEQEMLARYAKHGSFGLASAASRDSYHGARRLLEGYLGRPLESTADQALEGDDWWFIPERWIGMLGFVVEIGSGEIYPLGSGLQALYGRGCWGAIEAYLDGKVQPIRAS